MNRRSAIRNLMLVSAGSCCWKLIGDDEPNYVIHSEARLVLLDVSVTDARGATVSGVPRESFRVLENGQSQTITVFDDHDIPVTVGILVDESFSMTPKRGEVLTAAGIFIKESNPRDQMFVLNFNDVVRRGLPDNEIFSDDILELRTALYRGRSEGRTALYDAIVAGLEQLEMGRRDKKTLVVISDGGDNASRHTRVETLDRIQSSLATLYTIGLFEEDDRDRDPGLLRRLAAISGGQAYFPPDVSGMIPACQRIAKDIRSRYTVGYVPKPQDGKASLRRVDVRVTAPNGARLHARSRTRYWY
jgi:VWFA-related protein